MPRLEFFNAPAIIFGQVLDSFISIGSMTLGRLFAGDKMDEITDKLAQKVHNSAFNKGERFVDAKAAHDTAQFMVYRGVASLGNLANAAVQLTAAERTQEGGAKTAFVNSIFGRVISTGLGAVLGLSVDKNFTRPLGNILNNFFLSRNVDPKLASELGYGYASELVNGLFSVTSTLAANLTIKTQPAQAVRV